MRGKMCMMSGWGEGGYGNRDQHHPMGPSGLGRTLLHFTYVCGVTQAKGGRGSGEEESQHALFCKRPWHQQPTVRNCD